jgi:hypothetical protein
MLFHCGTNCFDLSSESVVVDFNSVEASSELVKPSDSRYRVPDNLTARRNETNDSNRLHEKETSLWIYTINANSKDRSIPRAIKSKTRCSVIAMNTHEVVETVQDNTLSSHD